MKEYDYFGQILLNYMVYMTTSKFYIKITIDIQFRLGRILKKYA